MPVAIDPSFLDDRAVHISLSLPENLLERIDERARAAGLDRPI